MRLPGVFGVFFALVLPAALTAQVPAACQMPGTLSLAQLRACVDTLNARRVADSVNAARDRTRVDSVLAANRQIQLTLEDIYRKLPPDGKTVTEYIASSAGRPGTTIGAIVNGDLILNGRLCISAACVADAGEQIQIAAQGGAGILFRSNMNGQQWQNPATHWAVVQLSDDGGLRLLQNQRWSSTGVHYDAVDPTRPASPGVHYDFIDPTRPTGAVGFDSMAEWSWNGQKPGQSGLGTQRIVLRTDEAARVVYFATWAEGWKVQFRGSTVGCKWCENIRWMVPYQ
jgi:hypothetical protein